jgi:superfamily II DNA or RNA helicase
MWDDAPWEPRKWQKEALPKAIAALREGRRPIVSAIMGAGKSILIAELVYQALLRARR